MLAAGMGVCNLEIAPWGAHIAVATRDDTTHLVVVDVMSMRDAPLSRRSASA